MTITAVCVHVHMSENRETLCDAERSCCRSMQCFVMTRAMIGSGCVTRKAICEHVQMSDERETLCDAENKWLPVDLDNKKTLCDDNNGLRACSHER